MSTIIRVRNSTRRVAFSWTATSASGVSAPFDLTGCTVQMLIDTERIESTPDTPVRVATVDGVVTDAANGQAYFPITTAITGTVRTLYFEVWVTDANAEIYPIDSGKIVIQAGF